LHGLAHLHVALGHDAAVRGTHDGVVQLLAGLIHRRLGRLQTRPGGIALRQGLVIGGLGDQLLLVYALDPLIFGIGLGIAGAGLGETGLGPLQPGPLVGVPQAQDELALGDKVVHVEQDLQHPARGLGRDGGLFDRLHDPVEQLLSTDHLMFGRHARKRRRTRHAVARQDRQGEPQPIPTSKAISVK
jgi:hypothetical protein